MLYHADWLFLFYNIMEELKKVLDRMPFKFTIHRFRYIAQSFHNVSSEILLSQEAKEFLRINCTRINMFNYEKIENNSIDKIEIERAIQLLKSTNEYKILKRTNDWSEI